MDIVQQSLVLALTFLIATTLAITVYWMRVHFYLPMDPVDWWRFIKNTNIHLPARSHIRHVSLTGTTTLTPFHNHQVTASHLKIRYPLIQPSLQWSEKWLDAGLILLGNQKEMPFYTGIQIKLVWIQNINWVTESKYHFADEMFNQRVASV